MIARRGTQRWSQCSCQAGPHWLARALALGLFLIGASISQAREARPLTGRVVDRSGHVAAGARVWVTGGRWDKPKTLAEATTDGQGRFNLPAVWGDESPAWFGLGISLLCLRLCDWA